MAWGFEIDFADLQLAAERYGCVLLKAEAAERLLEQGLLGEEDLL